MRLLGLCLLAAALAACQPSKFCLDCVRGDGGTGHDAMFADADLPDGHTVTDGGAPKDACTPTGPETCNGKDDDCDGVVDNGIPQVGQPCNVGLPLPCTQGTFVCTAGALTCGGGAVNPHAESCNGVDDDCDGTVDNGDPGGGTLCGTDVGDCLRGVNHCVGGTVVCQGSIGPQPETCDGHDEDCDGVIDNGDPGGGAPCGVMPVGTCVPGMTHCVGGSVQCSGATGPVLETCNGLDDDCDGTIDNGFDLMNDRNNCGMCGNVCSVANGVAACVMGMCQINYCLTDYWDLNMNPADGCEYNCSFGGTEICDGLDNDCNGFVDEGLTAPAICNQIGACMGTTASCTGAGGWKCNYGPAVSTDAMGDIIPETNCDGVDNDCDGVPDDSFPLKNMPCNNGLLGVCRGTGTFICNGTMDGLTCNITAPGAAPTAETCNGVDEDCDGVIDNGAPDNWVQITGAFGTKWIYQYEASHPDATAALPGGQTGRSCSTANRIPWTNVTYAQAQAACSGAGGRLCTESEWQRACETTAATPCTWSFNSACTTANTTKCNGNEYDCDAATPGDQDCLFTTGSATFPTCDANWGALPSQKIFDLSGNVKEWNQARSPGVNPLRGGSFNNTATGISCQFNFLVADDAFQFNNTGFRCCRDTAP